MRTIICLVAVCLVSVGGSTSQERIVGGSLTNVNQYPYIAGMLAQVGNAFGHSCGSTIINNRSVLTATHCLSRPNANQYRIRVGSTFANSGGTVHIVTLVVRHPNYNQNTFEHDIGLLRVSVAFSFGTNVQVARIAGASYNLADNQNVWAAGWGRISVSGPHSEQLRHVQLRTVNSNECQRSYGNHPITANMLCAGLPGRGVCSQDSGGPLAHNGVIVGVVSFGIMCGETNIPGVFARVSRYENWIRSNA